MPPPLFKPCVINSPFDGTLYNANMVEAENSFADLGPYVITGVTVSIGTGLSVNVASGTVSIGGRVAVASTTIAGLTDNQPSGSPNHLYLLNTGGGTSNTTGTPPANSVKIGTAVTAGGVVTSVSMGRTSGRQQFVQPQNLVHGGPAAGTASAGHPASVDLSNWNATTAEGKAVFGTLPAGAVPSAFTAPVTFTDTDAGTTTTPNVVTLQHRSSGTPSTNFGSTFLMQADNAANALANQFSVAALWSSPTAGAENSLAILRIRYAGTDVEVARLRPVGTAPAGGFGGQFQASSDFFHAGTLAGFFNTGPVAQPVGTRDLRLGLIDLGLRAAGGATPLDLNGGALTAATITGDCLGAVTLTPGSSTRNVIQGPSDAIRPLIVRQFSLTQSADLVRTENPSGLALSRWRGDGTFLNSPAGIFVARTDQASLMDLPPGTNVIGRIRFDTNSQFVFDTESGAAVTLAAKTISDPSQSNNKIQFVGNLTHYYQAFGFSTRDFLFNTLFAASNGDHFVIQDAGVDRFILSNLGVGNFILTDTGTNAVTDGLVLDHNTSGSPAAGFGYRLRARLQSSTTAGRDALAIEPQWATSTDATRAARAVFNIWDTAAREALRLEASGTAAMIGFLGAAAVARAAAYTLSGSVTRTFPTDPSGAFTGIATGVGGTPYAQLTDLNTLRTAVSTLIGVVRQMATDLGSTSGMGLLNA